ncbi:TPA: phage repressor protein [Streptococcus pyogenes]|nr:phage repressor protein [Streptococcus pyogenes]
MNRQVSIFEEVNDQGGAFQVVSTMTFHDRLLDIYGNIQEPLFRARDVAEMIDHSKTRNGYYDVQSMLRKVDDDEKVKGVPLEGATKNFRSGQKVWFLTEHGLYEVLMRSSKPKAKEFRKAVKNILKEIRLNGYYMQGELVQNSQPTPDIDDLSYIKQKLTDLQDVDSLQDLRWKMAKLYHVIETLDEY